VFSPKRDPTNLRVARGRKDEGEQDESTLRESMQSVGQALLHELATPAFAIALGWVFKQAAAYDDISLRPPGTRTGCHGRLSAFRAFRNQRDDHE
jgi:hypothetical protein